MLDLRDSDIEYIISQIKDIPNIKKLAVFGSRAKGTDRENSDIDIVVYGNIDKSLIFKLHELLEENAPYPFFVDIVSYKNADELLKTEIDKNNIVLFERQK